MLDITPDGVVVREIVEDLDLGELQKLTEPKFTLASDWKLLKAPAV